MATFSVMLLLGIAVLQYAPAPAAAELSPLVVLIRAGSVDLGRKGGQQGAIMARTKEWGAEHDKGITSDNLHNKHMSKLTRSRMLLGLDLSLLPTHFDWREKGVVSPVRNEISTDYLSSLAFAAVSAVESAYKIKTGRMVSLSVQQLLDCSGDDMFRYIADNGVTTEDEYPYTGVKGTCRHVVSPRNGITGGSLRTQNVRPRSEDEMAEILVSKGPLVIAMAADDQWKQFFDSLGDGVFDRRDDAIGLPPNHAVVLTGFGVKDGVPFWEIKNSWGPDWGMNGFGRIARGLNMAGLMSSGAWYNEIL